MPKHFLSIFDFTPDDLNRTLALAAELKAARRARAASPHAGAMAGRHVGLLFEKPSLRTRVTFTIGIEELGGSVVDIPSDVMHADREPLHDVARNLERWVDAVVIRTFAQKRLAIFTEAALSFIGVGIRPPQASWGQLVGEGSKAGYIQTDPHMLLFPVLAIGLTMLGFTFLGDGLRDALDPKGND